LEMARPGSGARTEAGQHQEDGATRPGEGTGPAAVLAFAVLAAAVQVRRQGPGQPDGTEKDALERGPPRVVPGFGDGPRRGAAHADQRTVQPAETFPCRGDQLAAAVARLTQGGPAGAAAGRGG
jgi:hypothetical protein